MLATLTPDNKLSFRCDHCNAQLRIPVSLAGVVGPCPKCGETITAPESNDPPASEPPVQATPALRRLAPKDDEKAARVPPAEASPKPQSHPPRQRSEKPASSASKEPLKSLRPAPKPEPASAPAPSTPVVRKVAATRPASTTLLSKTPVEPPLDQIDTEGTTRPVKPWTRRLAVDASTAAHLVSRPPGAGASGSIYHQPNETSEEPSGPPIEVLGKLSAGAESIDLNNVAEVSAPRSFFNLRDADEPTEEPPAEPIEDEQSLIERMLSEADSPPSPQAPETESAQPQLDLDAIEPYEDVAVIDELVADSSGEVVPAPLGLELTEDDAEAPDIPPVEEIDLSFEPETEDVPLAGNASPIFLDTEESALLDAPELPPAPEVKTERISTVGRIQRRQHDAPALPETTPITTRPISFLDTPLGDDEAATDNAPIERPQSLFTSPRPSRADHLQPTLGNDDTATGPTVIQIDSPSGLQRSGDLGRRAKESLLAASLAMGKSTAEDEQEVFVPRDYEAEEAAEEVAQELAEPEALAPPVAEPEVIEPAPIAEPEAPEVEVAPAPAVDQVPDITPEPEMAPALAPVEPTPEPTTTVVAKEAPRQLAPIHKDEVDEEALPLEATPFTESLDDGDDGYEPPALLPSLSPIEQPLIGQDYESEEEGVAVIDDRTAPLSMSESLHLPKAESTLDFLDELDTESDRNSSPIWKWLGGVVAALLVIGFSIYGVMAMFVDAPESGDSPSTLASTETPTVSPPESVDVSPPAVIDVPVDSVFTADAPPENTPPVAPIEMPAIPEPENTMETGVAVGDTVAQARPTETTTPEVVILPDPFAMMSPPNPDQLKIPPKPGPNAEATPQAAATPDAPKPTQTVIGQTIGASDWPAGGEPTPPANLLGQQLDENGNVIIQPKEAPKIVDAADAVLADAGAEIGPITETNSMATIAPAETPAAQAEEPSTSAVEDNPPPLLAPIRLSKGDATPSEDLETLTSPAPGDGTAPIEAAQAQAQAQADAMAADLTSQEPAVSASLPEPTLTINDTAPAIGAPTAALTSAISMPELPSDLVTPGALAADPPVELTAPSEKAATMLTAPRNLLDQFLATATPEERLPFFYQHEKYRADIEQFYATHSMRTFELPDVEFSSLGEDPDSDRDYYVFDVRTRESPSFLPVVVRNTAEGPMVDWKAYRDFQGRLFAEYVDSDQTAPESFRLRVARASYFGQPDGDDFTTKDDYVCFRITPPYLDYERYAFVKKGTGIAEQMQEICYWGLDPELIAVLTVARETFPHGVEHLVIQKIDGIGLIPPASGNYLQQ